MTAIGIGISPAFGSAAGAGGAAFPTATYTVTTTGAQTHTINSFGVAVGETVTIDWGDGSTSDYTGTAQRTHNYAEAGDWAVKIFTPEHVRIFDIQDGKVTLNSTDIAVMSGVTEFTARLCKAGNFDSADVAGWNPTRFNLSSMSSGFTGTFNSADVAAWNPNRFFLYSMPSGYAGTFSSTDVAGWNPQILWAHSLPASYTINITDGFAGFAACNNFQMQGNGLSQADVDAIFWSLYQASIVPRTVTGGEINVGGSNSAPSGTFQAAASCPVTSSTPGKEVAHELINDGCAAGFNTWAVVTITA